MLQFPFTYSKALCAAYAEFGSEHYNQMLAQKGVLMPDGRRYKLLAIRFANRNKGFVHEMESGKRYDFLGNSGAQEIIAGATHKYEADQWTNYYWRELTRDDPANTN